jgi:CubicO group peptidase (beta-lactamase class C family)
MDRWSAVVVPFEDVFTFHLVARTRPHGAVGALLFNPERDWGAQIGVERLVREGDVVRLMGSDPKRALASGTYDTASKVLTLDFPGRGNSFDFRRDGEHSDYYPRGKDPEPYFYRPPPPRDDGWPTATLEEVNIDRAAVEALIQQLIDTRLGTRDTPKIHALLVARHGKLVLEEYFHGMHRDQLHDTRSAAKSVTATLIGAAMQSGAPITLQTSVYKTMNGGSYPAGLEADKRAMTLEHLLTMSSGFYCDDTDPKAPGNEEVMQEQSEEPDYYRYTLRVPMASRPGEKAVYCSANPNLALGVMSRALKESPFDTFDRLLAAPLRIERYGWFMDPAGHPYGGGGVQFLARDFMKFGQLMLNGGTWEGRRILSQDFVARASGRLYHLRRFYYGYLWWSVDYRYKDRTVAAFAAGGAGGQSVIVIPELDLVIATYGGNYSSGGTYYVQLTLTPKYLLPAVRETGDDPGAPVYPREYYQPRLGDPTDSGPVKTTP